MHSPLPPLRAVIEANGLTPRKALSQNFLLDPAICARIAAAAGDLAGANVIEVGPGPGGLTRALLATDAARVVAVEADPRAVAAIQGLADTDARLRALHADALAMDLAALTPAPRVLVANLPYAIATPLLTQWLRQRGAFARMVLMFQREVAQRIAAAAGTPDYGRLSVLAQWLADIRPVMTLPPGAFWPAPKVHSRVLVVGPRAAKADDPPVEAVERLTALAFGQRRKMLRQSLKAHLPALKHLGLDPTLRAADVTPQQYVALTALVHQRS
ncbi:MAG TPA: 16S rRNA (adenine(1518)-N(6)/adenine(1519)-N(6))-dimethyltransferase [Rhodospirillaceae bacterium]|jgi:16S rRNA (adenine1518-N6/adenine1519-N6)-dimethyltransferase|nr:16S rRNA (adenine(1518)-N(6)/adenine(1519)-N(6))-dimethyltransferase RsmA [Alphaproteobacteria bacterium]HBH26678.1 16S rRNA (adenine(1518)-N(6)/adenine(1519)-N(6))-dimethyltransferase [Rhodospirillaceae bacterium]